MTTDRINAFLDALPRTRVGTQARQVSAFRACAVAGAYTAVAAALGGGLLAGRSLPLVAVLCGVGALALPAYTRLRRRITGRERLVLLEHVWFAGACVAGTLRLLGEPVGAYLDVSAPALALLLAGGRTGCLLAGCCRGHPSAVGVAYPAEHVRSGFPAYLVGVRLFPVQAVEAAGLVAIGLTGLAALPWARAGAVFAWFLAAYAVLRFGTESLRGDPRPHLLGLSVARWMCLAQLGLALWMGRARTPAGRDLALLGVLLAGLAVALAVWRSRDPRRRLLAPGHLRELRDAAEAAAGTGSGAAGLPLRTTSRGVRVGVTRAGPAGGEALHLSLSLPDGMRDLPLLCDLAAHAFPSARPEAARASTAGVLHLGVPPTPPAGPEPAERLGAALLGAVALGLQRAADAPSPAPDPRGGYFGAGVRVGRMAGGGAG